MQKLFILIKIEFSCIKSRVDHLVLGRSSSIGYYYYTILFLTSRSLLRAP